MDKSFLIFICSFIFVAVSVAKPRYKAIELDPLLEQEVISGLKELKRIPHQNSMYDYMGGGWSEMYDCRNCEIINIGNGVGNYNEISLNLEDLPHSQ